MSKGGLRFLAAVLTTGIIVVPFLGLDNLPRGLRARMDAAQAAYSQSREDFAQARSEVERDLASDPELFQAHSMITAFPQRFTNAGALVETADRDAAELARLRKADRRGDRAAAEGVLARLDAERRAFSGEAGNMRAEARHWVQMKQDLPGQLERMERDYQAVHAVDITSVAPVVEKAEADWPAKKADLEARLAVLRGIPAAAEKAWQASEPARRQAAAGKYAGLDYATLFTSAEALHTAAGALPAKSAELKELAGQLYVSWDRILVDLERSGRQERLRTVRTGLKGDVTTNDQWVAVTRAEFQAAEKNLGMAVEHKPAGKYDFEAEKTAQPAGFAYMASPAQGRNQYGYWDNRGGQSFWVWYGQYALLRDLLFNRNYRPLERRDWEGYRQSRGNGQTYYGRDQATGAPRYGSAGSDTQSRYAGSNYARKGGFGESKYATRPGGFSGSRYTNRPSFPRSSPRGSFGGGRSFGRRR